MFHTQVCKVRKEESLGGGGAIRKVSGETRARLDTANTLLTPLTTGRKRIFCILDRHSRKTATLYPDGYYCFACKRGLDPFGYFCATHNLTLTEGLERLGIR